MRITGAYPPPLTRPAPPASRDAVLAPLSRTTRYDRSRHRAPRPVRSHPARSRATRGWTAASVGLAAAGVCVVVLAPQDGRRPARIDEAVAVVAPLPATLPATSPATTAPPAAQALAPVLQMPASDPVRVQIPALGVTSEIMHLGLERDGSMEVPPGAYPVGWYEHGPTPGALGPAVLAGHVDWAGDPGAFYGLRDLLPGDAVTVDRTDGTVATFRVDRVEEHAKNDFPTDEVYGDIDHAGLRLITCGGTFDEDAGDYDDNVIVFASLVTTG